MSFLKVKRKREDDAKEAFILASKKTKLEDITQDAPIFELTSTAIQEQDINNFINKTLARRNDVRLRIFDFEKIRNKIRAENQQHTKHNKLKMLNYMRKINESDANESVPVINVSSTEEDENQQEHYVYDLYYSNKCIDVDPDFDDYFIHEIDYTENALEDENLDEDEDDSNDESNWRNDYPDEEETDDSDDFLSREMKRTYLNSDYSLSSDDYDEKIENDQHDVTNNLKKLDRFDYYDEIMSDTESDEGSS